MSRPPGLNLTRLLPISEQLLLAVWQKFLKTNVDDELLSNKSYTIRDGRFSALIASSGRVCWDTGGPVCMWNVSRNLDVGLDSRCIPASVREEA